MTVPQSPGVLYISRPGLMFDPGEPSAGGTVTTLPATPAVPAATPATPATPAAPAVDPRVAQLEKDLEEAKADQQRWRDAQAVFARPGTVDAGTQREAMARSLRAAGWQETDVQQYLQQLNEGGGADPAPEPEPAKPARGGAKRDGADPDLQAEIDRLREQGRETSVQMAAYARDGKMASLEQDVPEYKAAIEAIRRVHGDTAATNAQAVFREEIKSLAAQAFMKRAKDRGGQMDPNWMLDAVPEAAKVVVRKHQWGIGDPNKVGRTPETGTGDPFAGKPPVAPPSFDPKRADMTDKAVEDFLADALPRLGQLAGGVPSGPTRA